MKLPKIPTTRQRVLSILVLAMHEAKIGTMYVEGENLPCPDGWVDQWVLCSIRFTGSTEGKRRLRELRVDPELQKKYEFETKKDGHKWYYRIRTKERPAAGACVQAQLHYC